MLLSVFPLFTLFNLVKSQFPPEPKYDKVIQSKVYPNTRLSYKATKICETTPGVKAYSGYVSLPIDALSDLGAPNDYQINLFFWFFEARKTPETAPITLWLNGGPGTSSLRGLFHGNGPCYVNPDSKTTRLNPFSWNNEVNMLYIDQPVQAGFSYDALVNITMNLMGGEGMLKPGQEDMKPTDTMLLGTGHSHSAFQTAQNTKEAGAAVWRFLQVFIGEFPEHKFKGKGFSIWSTGYAGRFAPTFASFFLKQSQKPDKSGVTVKIDTIGVVNGFIDMAVQQLKFPLFGYNNTYGIQAVDAGMYQGVTKRYNGEDGCGTNLKFCRERYAKWEKDGTNASLTAVGNSCDHASNICSTVEGGYSLFSGRNTKDIGRLNPDAFPPRYHIGYLNSREVQEALGVPRNYSETSAQVGYAFHIDEVLGGHLENMGVLLDQGVNVALVYGDRDYSNNWLGGEAISTAVNWKDAATFKNSGYADVKVNSSYVGGMVRQTGRLSFTRVFDAGNEAYAYQPETLFKIFSRAMSSQDIATGSTSAKASEYKTKGPSSTWARKNKEPCPVKNECYIWAPETCTTIQKSAVQDGYAVVKDYFVVGVTDKAPEWAKNPIPRKGAVPKGCSAL